jgi:hypothetical protein
MPFDLALLDPASPTFFKALRSSPPKISSSQKQEYLGALCGIVADADADVTVAVVRALIEFFTIDSANVSAFRSGRLLRKFPWNAESLDLLHWAATSAPDLLNDAAPAISRVVTEHPQEVLLLIALFWRDGRKAVANPWPFLELLFTHSDTFSDRKTAENFVTVIAHIVNSEDFPKKRAQDFWNAIQPVLSIRSTPIVTTAYYALCPIAKILDPIENFPSDLVASHLRREDLQHPVAALLLRVQTPPLSLKVASELLVSAERHLRLTLVLLKFAQTPAFAQILTVDLSWLGKNLPTFGDTLRLAAVVLYERERRVEVARCDEIADFLMKIFDEENGLLIMGVFLRRLAVDKAILKKLYTTRVLAQFFDGTLHNKDDDLVITGLSIAGVIASLGYCPVLDSVAAAIVKLVKGNRSTAFALKTGLKLAAYPKGIEAFNALNFDAVLAPLRRDPDNGQVVVSLRAKLAAV